MELVELLERIKANIDPGRTSNGMCYLANIVLNRALNKDEIDFIEYQRLEKLFGVLIDKHIKETEQAVFYSFDGEETSYNDQFVWPKEEVDARIEWLDNQIKELKYDKAD